MKLWCTKMRHAEPILISKSLWISEWENHLLISSLFILRLLLMVYKCRYSFVQLCLKIFFCYLKVISRLFATASLRHEGIINGGQGDGRERLNDFFFPPVRLQHRSYWTSIHVWTVFFSRQDTWGALSNREELDDRDGRELIGKLNATITGSIKQECKHDIAYLLIK